MRVLGADVDVINVVATLNHETAGLPCDLEERRWFDALEQAAPCASPSCLTFARAPRDRVRPWGRVSIFAAREWGRAHAWHGGGVGGGGAHVADAEPQSLGDVSLSTEVDVEGAPLSCEELLPGPLGPPRGERCVWHP